MHPKVSIIVPCYGVEQYLDRCVESLVKQTLLNIEIILVDDLSPDRTPEMCDEWAKKDSRIRVVHKAQNEGLGLACNTGIEVATGEYIAFCDSDDYVDKGMYETMYNAAAKENVDVVFSGIKTVDQNEVVRPMNQPTEYSVKTTKRDIHHYVMNMIASEPSDSAERRIPMSAKIVLYRKTLIDKCNLRFYSERVLISEDLNWNLDVLCHAESILTIPQSFYYYYNNTESISKRVRTDRFKFFKIQREDLLERTRRYGMPIETDVRINRMFIGYCRFYIGTIVRSDLPLEKRKQLVSEICKDSILLQVLRDYPVSQMPKTHRIMAFFMKHNWYKAMDLMSKLKLMVNKNVEFKLNSINIIIVSPSLDPTKNVSGISAVTQFIISNNLAQNYMHFELGKKDNERGGIFRIGSLIKSLYLWNRLLKQYKGAIVHYNFPLSKLSILRDSLFMGLARCKGNPTLIHLHGGSFLTAPHIPFSFFFILKKLFNMPVPIVVLSEKEKDIIEKRFGCRNVKVLPNCVDLTEANEYHKQYNCKAPLTVGYLGRIAESKGMDDLLRAFIELKKQDVAFTLKIAGKEEVDGSYLNKFKTTLGNSFFYEGVVGGKMKDDFLKSLDIFVLPSHFEGLPMSLLECMSFGVVPMVTPVGSIPEVVTDDINGRFIQIKDAASIVSCFNDLNNDHNLRERLGNEAKRTIFEHFNPSVYIKDLNSIYQDIKI